MIRRVYCAFDLYSNIFSSILLQAIFILENMGQLWVCQHDLLHFEATTKKNLLNIWLFTLQITPTNLNLVLPTRSIRLECWFTIVLDSHWYKSIFITKNVLFSFECILYCLPVWWCFIQFSTFMLLLTSQYTSLKGVARYIRILPKARHNILMNNIIFTLLWCPRLANQKFSTNERTKFEFY